MTARRTKNKIRYCEGSCFFVPLRAGGFARGVVARLDGKGRIFAYFFGPKLAVATCAFDDLAAPHAILIGRCGDLGLLNREWPLAGTLQDWNRGDWPLPTFYREDRGAQRAWLSYYNDENLDFLREEPVELGEGSQNPYDRLMGYGSVEIAMTKLLS